jgi:3-deoxy-D-manno-octulosonic-acid transferase
MYAAGRLRDVSFLRNPEFAEPSSAGRLGQASQPRPAGCLLWAHARTSGELGAVVAVAQELSRLRGETINILATTLDNAPLFPAVADTVLHELVPGETSGSVSRFLDHWQPDMGLVVGLPDRPNLISAAQDRGIPLFLAASNRDAIGAQRRIGHLSASLLGKFQACLAASAADGEVLKRHLDEGTRVEVTGPLSDTIHALPCHESERDTLARLLGGRPVWLAAHVTESEVAAVEAAQRKAFRAAHRLLLILVPRDAALGPKIAGSLETMGWHVALRSAGGEPDENIQVYVADTEDEMGLWYRLAPITFVGGTLEKGAQPSDPYQPAALGSAVLHGPNVGPAPARFRRLAEAGASVSVESENNLGTVVQTLLSPDKTAMLAHAGWMATTESAHVVERLAELMDSALDAGRPG